MSPLKGVWQPGAALLQASHSGTQLAPGQGFRYSGSGIQASLGEKLCLQLGNLSWMLLLDSVRCVECWCMCRVAVCSAVPGAELCGAVSLVTTTALSLGCQLPLHSPHRHTHRLDTTLYTLDTAHFTHTLSGYYTHFTHYTGLKYYSLYTTQISTI